MKKFLGLMVMSLVALLPLSASAATEIAHNCDEGDANGIVSCTITYKVTEATDNFTVKLTEQGGAEVQTISNAADSDWTVSSQDETNGVWTILLTSPGTSGEGDLFNFTYKKSGETDCKVLLGLGDKTVEITPEPTPDKPADQEDTGATLPYIALGAIAIIAVGAYVVTKNKSKMYKI